MKKYDVIIIGAGIAGIECAKNLGNSGLDVLVIERHKEIGKKVCAGGIVPCDLEYIPKSFLNFGFKKLLIHYKNKIITFPTDKGIISTINREKLLNYVLSNLKKFDNIKVLTGVSVLKIISNDSLKISSGQKLKFRFLVGADGAISVVRRYLNLPENKLVITFQYRIPKIFKNFETYLDKKLFGTGYVWIFPHKDYTFIGCCSDIRFINPKELKNNFNSWLKEHNISTSDAKFESAIINYDYNGYKFGNIFLTGDAAGLTSGTTGKGIYSAFLSGKQVADDILQRNDHSNLITNWLKKKTEQEKVMFFLKNSLLRDAYYSLSIRLMSQKKVQEKLINIL